MDDFAKKVLDAVFPKVGDTIETLANLLDKPVDALRRRLKEDKGVVPSFLFYFLLSSLAFSIIVYGIYQVTTEFDVLKLGYGYIISQFFLLFSYSAIATLALKITRIKSTWRSVLMSTAYLYGQGVVVLAVLCSTFIYVVVNKVCDIELVLLSLIATSACFFCFGWWTMCAAHKATRLQALCSFIVVAFFSYPMGEFLAVISSVFVHI